MGFFLRVDVVIELCKFAIDLALEFVAGDCFDEISRFLLQADGAWLLSQRIHRRQDHDCQSILHALRGSEAGSRHVRRARPADPDRRCWCRRWFCQPLQAIVRAPRHPRPDRLKTPQAPDRIAVPRYLGERTDTHADLQKPIVSCRIHIVSDHAKSSLDEASGINLAHQAEADQSDGCPSRHGVWRYSGGAIASSRATTSRLSPNAFGTGMPRCPRSRRIAWLCSPGSQIRSTPGSRRE